MAHGSLQVIFPNGEEMVAGDGDLKAGQVTVGVYTCHLSIKFSTPSSSVPLLLKYSNPSSSVPLFLLCFSGTVKFRFEGLVGVTLKIDDA